MDNIKQYIEDGEKEFDERMKCRKHKDGCPITCDIGITIAYAKSFLSTRQKGLAAIYEGKMKKILDNLLKGAEIAFNSLEGK